MDGCRHPVARAGHRRQRGALQRRQRHAPDAGAGEGSRHARPAALGRPQRHGHELERLRVDQPGRLWRRERQDHVLLPDVSATRRGQPHDDGRLRVRAVRPRERRRGWTRGPGAGLHRLRQLLQGPRGRRPARTHDSPRRRSAGCASGGRHQLQVLALALRQRPGRRGQGHPDQQRPLHSRRRVTAGVHRHPAAAGRPARRDGAARHGSATRDAARATTRSPSRPTGGCR